MPGAPQAACPLGLPSHPPAPHALRAGPQTACHLRLVHALLQQRRGRQSPLPQRREIPSHPPPGFRCLLRRVLPLPGFTIVLLESIIVARQALCRYAVLRWSVNAMPAYINPARCDACSARATPACVHICPSDVLHFDSALGQPVNVEPDQCWECYACVKACPQGAVQVRGYADVIPLGALLAPRRSDHSIAWDIRFRSGRQLHLEFAIRTTTWNSIAPFKGIPAPTPAALAAPSLCGQQHFLNDPELPASVRSAPSAAL